MIITLTRYIFLLFLISSSTFAKEIDVTFEVFHAQNNYMDIAREKALKLQKDNFRCYIVRGKSELSVRCNDSQTTKQMQRSINRLNKKNIAFTIINRDRVVSNKMYKTLNEFYLGYAAFDRRDYKKALKIFKYNYEKEKNYEHAYAYSLALMKTRQYEKAIKVLEPYKNIKKANKLSSDIASTYMYRELKKKNYDNARSIVDSYLNRTKRLHAVINKQEVDDTIKNREYKKATLLANKYNLNSKAFDIEYMQALDFVNMKKYDQANLILAPYINSQKRAKNLYISNLISSASKSYENKNYKDALDKLAKHRNDSRVKTLYNDILYNRALENGWNFVEKTPKSALTSFKESCRIKKEYSCYSGMMYSYYNLKMYKESLYLADKLYSAKKIDELSIVAMRSSLKLKNFEDAQFWFDRTKNKKGLTSPYLLETYLTIDEYIKAEDYEEATNIISYLKNLYPQNIEVLKREMQLFIVQKEYDNAQDIAQEILLIDEDSLEAKYTLALYEFEHQDYEGCAQRLGDDNLTEPYQKELYNRCSAYERANKRDINSAKSFIENIDNDNIRAAFYLEIGDLYKSRDESEAIRAYSEAKKYKKDDIDIEMIYLYALKDFTKDKLLDKELIVAYKNFPSEHKKLDTFKIDYEKDRLYSYYKNKRYSECYKYSNVIQENQNDKDVYRMGGWCAYSLKKYNEAKEKFATINMKYGENSQDIYAYALSAYQLQEKKRAVEALDRIEIIQSEKEGLLIAGLYTDLHEQEKARTLLMGVPASDKRSEALVNINKSYTRASYENAASIGMYYKSQTGVEGKSRFEKLVIPVDYDYFNKEDEYHIYFDGDLMFLRNGYLEEGASAYLDFGLGTSTQNDALASDIGFMPKIGIDYKNIRVEIGTTPIGAKISPELTWLLSGYLRSGNWMGSLKFEQKEVDETMLSFVGERATDGALEVNWGRVVKRGIDVGISYDANVALSLNLAYYPQIFGLNIEDNNEKKATVMALYHPKVESIAYVDIGAIVAFDAYEKNSNSFTYGHGGYFSPQQFFLGALFAQFGDIISKDFYYQSKIGLGFEGFIVDDSYKFPLEDGIVNSGKIQKGYRDGGIVYKAALQLGYKINQNLDLVSGISLERINGYSVQQMSFAFVYRFEKSRYSSFNTFSLNHRVDQIIK